MIDKVIVSNRTALVAKYGNNGVKAVETALRALAAADGNRGLKSQIVWIDNAAQMKKLGGKPPINAKDQRGAKLAVDAIAKSLSPDYIVLLDGPDVIPHIVLDNPVPEDGDTGIDSDLPYASPEGFSRQASRYLTVTRVVGRLPNTPGKKDPGALIKLIEASIRAKPLAPAAYKNYFGLSAEVWEASTKMSLDTIFSDHAGLKVSPPAGPPGTNVAFKKLSHFINCHGAALSPEFYGQRGESYPEPYARPRSAIRLPRASRQPTKRRMIDPSGRLGAWCWRAPGYRLPGRKRSPQGKAKHRPPRRSGCSPLQGSADSDV